MLEPSGSVERGNADLPELHAVTDVSAGKAGVSLALDWNAGAVGER